MTHAAIAQAADSSISEPAWAGSDPVYVSTEADDRVVNWGPVFSVFGDELDAVIKAMEDAFGADDLAEQARSASRRYGALLEAMCNGIEKEKKPYLAYDCCDGVAVMLVRQRPSAAEDRPVPQVVYESEKTSLTEQVFLGILGRSIVNFFEKKVPTLGMVTVTLDGGDYLFMRAEDRDPILKTLCIGTTAQLY